MKVTAQDLEILVALHFGMRQNVVVPNVSWGLGLRYEADVVVLRPSGYALEVEIKCTRADVRADLKKDHQHDSIWFRQLWFCVAPGLEDMPEIPAKAGILVARGEPLSVLETLRAPRVNTQARRLPEAKQKKLLELGCMRIWTLKRALQYQRQQRETHNV